jgi:hypothetical protein
VDFTDDSFSPLTNYCAIMFKDTAVIGSNDGSADYRATKRIRMGTDFTVSSSSGSSKFEVAVQESALELAWFEPSGSYAVPRYEKLEIGVALPDSLMQLVTSYMETGEGLNPFDPDQLDVYAIFERRDANGDWTIDRVTNGFYFEDFELNYELENIPSWGLWDWLPVATNFPFRIRFAPTQIVEHRCQVFIAWNGSQMESSPFNFWVSSSDNPGFVRVAPNNRYLEYPNNSLFFPVGQNLSPNERMARAFYSDGNYTLARCSGLLPGGDARSMVSALGYGLSQCSGTRRYAPVIYHEIQC